MIKTHRKIKYESTNKKIATVSAKGKVKGIAKLLQTLEFFIPKTYNVKQHV